MNMPNVLVDAETFQRTAQLTAAEYLHCMMNSLIPPPVGFYNGLGLWDAETVSKTSAKLEQLKQNGMFASVSPSVVAAVVSPAALPSTHSQANAVISNEPAPNPDAYPDEMNQVLASRFLGISTSWLTDRTKDGLLNSRKDSSTVLYKKTDLLALMELPVYRFRKRNGYIGGILKNDAKRKPGVNTPFPPSESRASDLLGDHAASDYLGLERGILSLTRKDGSGPAWVNVDGVPKYRLIDLDAYKERLQRDEVTTPKLTAQVIRKPAEPTAADKLYTLTHADAAEWLGISSKALSNLRTRKKGPNYQHSQNGHNVLYCLADLREWRANKPAAIAPTNPDAVLTSQRERAALAREAMAKKRAAAKSNGVTLKHKPRRPATKSATLGGARIRH